MPCSITQAHDAHAIPQRQQHRLEARLGDALVVEPAHGGDVLVPGVPVAGRGRRAEARVGDVPAAEDVVGDDERAGAEQALGGRGRGLGAREQHGEVVGVARLVGVEEDEVVGARGRGELGQAVDWCK